MYTKQQFGKELKEKVVSKESISKIARWAYNLYLKEDLDNDFDDLLLDLNTMENGPEFEYSYEELKDIADRLIAGENVKL